MDQPQPNIQPMTQWFIFTRSSAHLVPAETITKAIASWRKVNPAGEIVGVIRGAMAEVAPDSLKSTPVYGVICCGGKSS